MTQKGMCFSPHTRVPRVDRTNVRENPQKPEKPGFTGVLRAARKIAGAIYIIGGAPPRTPPDPRGTPLKPPF
jgi:hypothetical protein